MMQLHLQKNMIEILSKGIDIDIPENYFPNDDPTAQPLNTWRSHTHLLFSNWLNYYVYQANTI